MTLDEQTLADFQSRVRLLVAHCRQLQQENARLRVQLEQARDDNQGLHDNLERLRSDYDALKTARMLAVADDDIEGAKRRIAALIRDVDRCMAILAEQQ